MSLDKTTGEPVLLFPEGVVHLSPTAYAVLSRCNGRASIHEIVASLVEEFEADEASIRGDVVDCLTQLQQRKLVLLTEP